MRSDGYLTPKTLGAKTIAWLEEIRGGVAPRPHLRLEPENAALVVVDMLHYFADPQGRCFLPAAGAIVDNIQRLLEAWRSASLTICYTQHCHRGEGDLGMLGKFFSDYIRAGKKEAQIIEPLRPGANDRVLQKNTYDAFLGTGLTEFLRSRSCSQVVITGVLTHMCCETTARSAFCRGFEVYIPVDCVADASEERHFQSLKGLADCVAVITSLEEVLSQCKDKRS